MSVARTVGASALPSVSVGLANPALLTFMPGNGRDYRFAANFILELVPNTSGSSGLLLSLYKCTSQYTTPADIAAGGVIPILVDAQIAMVAVTEPFRLEVPINTYPDPAYPFIAATLIESGPATWRCYAGLEIVY